MSSKRERNRYPKLPQAVENLLALHGLRAVPMKQREWRNGASVGWRFNVVPDKPAPKGKTAAMYAHIGGHRPVFTGKSDDSLELWLDKVKGYENGRGVSFPDFEIYSNMTRHLNAIDWCGVKDEASFSYIDELGDPIDVRPLPGPRGPSRYRK